MGLAFQMWEYFASFVSYDSLEEVLTFEWKKSNDCYLGSVDMK